MSPNCTPAIGGVGQNGDRPEDPADGPGALGLAGAAVVGGEAPRAAARLARQDGEANRDGARAASSAGAPDHRRPSA